MINRKRVKVLCVSDYYLPGFKGGGPIRTISNMCELLDNEVDFWIFTRDRDLGSRDSYPSVIVDEWSDIKGVRIFYASPANFRLGGLLEAIRQQDFDLLYLNSFFSIFGSISLCIAGYFNRIYSLPILLAPRGEFSPGALAIKPIRKKIYIKFVRLLGVYRNINFHASTKMEADEIRNVFQSDVIRTYIAADLVDATKLRNSGLHKLNSDMYLKVIFISRISPKKNLDGLIAILSQVSCNIQLSIYGPIEDEFYWSECKSLIRKLPDHISVSYLGELSPISVTSVFERHHVFIFPTHGENFGHVIFESLSVGTPVMLSEHTPWVSDNKGGVQVISINDVESWRIQIEHFAKLTQTEYQERRHAALEYAKSYLESSNSLSENVTMFRVITSADFTSIFQNGNLNEK